MLKLHPELEKPIKRIPRLPFHREWMLPLVRPIFNIAARTRPVDGVRVYEIDHRNIRLRIIEPVNAKVSKGLLWFHGGAHLTGKPNSLDDVASQFALGLDAIIAIPYYRLAPENPFPADLDDAFTGWQWLTEYTQDRGIAADKLAIVGNSAGGGIAASLVQRIHDQGDIRPAAQVLFYPMLDDRTVLDQTLSPINHYIWNNQANAVAWKQYLAPHTPGCAELPDYAAPGRREDLSGLPPMWLGVAGIDLFRDECIDYAERFKATGGECEMVVVDGAPHAFEALAPDAAVSKSFIQSALQFLQKTLA